MKLYVAQYFYYEEEHIIGVFSTKEKADNAIQAFINRYKNYLSKDCLSMDNSCCSVLEYSLDKPNFIMEHVLEDFDSE